MLQFGQVVPPSHVVSVLVIFLYLFFSIFSGFVRPLYLPHSASSFPHFILVLTQTGISAHPMEKAPSRTDNGCSTDEMQPIFQPGRRFLFAFISILTITLAAALDATSLSIALPILTRKLHGTAIEAFWAGTSFLLTSAVSRPVIAGLSHVFGRKNLIFCLPRGLLLDPSSRLSLPTLR